MFGEASAALAPVRIYRSFGMYRLSFWKFVTYEDGATAIEYALIAAIIAVGIVSSLTMVGSSLQNDLNSVATGFQSLAK
jgi:pilus assembly protein Flp/PilA